MIALALLFIIIIALLVVVTRLLQKFFDAYGNAFVAHCPSEETLTIKNETDQLNKELNNLAKDREVSWEKCFSSIQVNKVPSLQKKELLLQSLNIYIRSILKLLKTD